MKNTYSVDIASDIIRGCNNLGGNSLIEDMSQRGVKLLIKDYINEFGSPSIVSGSLLWSNAIGDTYFLSIYKNSRPYKIKKIEFVLGEMFINSRERI